MPGVSKVKKEDIIQACLEIIKESDMDHVNARAIAKKLNCSTQPIFYQFKSMEEIKEEVFETVKRIYCDRQNQVSHDGFEYKDTGINYIKFAKEEPKLFQLVFMNDKNIAFDQLFLNDKAYADIEKIIGNKTGFDKEKIKKFHTKMWMFTHGIACLIANQTCQFTDEEISKLLTEEFNALMLLERK